MNREDVNSDILAKSLMNYLQISGKSDFCGGVFVSGVLDVSVKRHISRKGIQVPISILVFPNWIKYIPLLRVIPETNWLRIGKEWHVYENRTMCLEYDERWEDHLQMLALQTSANIPDLAAQWITNAASHILQVHYTCHVTHRTKWPSSIDSWGHGTKLASAEYEAEKIQIKTKR